MTQWEKGHMFNPWKIYLPIYQGQKLDFLDFDIMLKAWLSFFFKMGSLVLQFRTVAEIWWVKVGPYASFFWKMYEKIPQKLRFCIFKNSKNGNKSPKTHFLELKMDMGPKGNILKIFTRQIFDILIFCRDMTHFPRKKSIFSYCCSFFAENATYLGKKSKNQKCGR